MSSIERQEDNRKQKKELRREYPSGWFHFTQHDAVPILVDALLALSESRVHQDRIRRARGSHATDRR